MVFKTKYRRQCASYIFTKTSKSIQLWREKYFHAYCKYFDTCY
nr:MAG TPA: hypothetical protein [Caudoviricetes sp.]